MKTSFKISKTTSYAKNENGLFIYDKSEKNHRKMTEAEKQVKTAYKSEYGWEGPFEAETIEKAYDLRSNAVSEIKQERTIKNRVLREERQTKIKELIALDEIPTTVENLQLVMECLNGQNWGSWYLPKMSIGYKANQYDCDGKIATTIILDKPLNGVVKFQYGAPRGHLSQYTSITRF